MNKLHYILFLFYLYVFPTNTMVSWLDDMVHQRCNPGEETYIAVSDKKSYFSIPVQKKSVNSSSSFVDFELEELQQEHAFVKKVLYISSAAALLPIGMTTYNFIHMCIDGNCSLFASEGITLLSTVLVNASIAGVSVYVYAIINQ